MAVVNGKAQRAFSATEEEVELLCTSTSRRRPSFTALVKKVVGTHYFLAIFGPIGAHFSPQPLRQPHGMTVSHIVKVNHTVVERGLEYC